MRLTCILQMLTIHARSLATVHREYAALIALEFYEYCDFILNPRLSTPQSVDQKQLIKTMKTFNLNEPQARAIESSLRSNGFSLIQGYVNIILKITT
jgi:senataxin